jgi:hypothetical protein
MASLRDFHGIHYGECLIVCGLGASINSFRHPQRFRTIGVNDIGRAFTPDYLFVMDAPQSFAPERFQHIQTSGAKYIFTDHDLDLTRENIVKFPIRASPRPRFDDPDSLYLIGRPPTSPFLALCLAAHMGAKAIGVIGVDFTSGHFFARDGDHRLSSKFTGIDRRFYVLGSALLDRGVKVFNLSAGSKISAFPRLTVEDFYAIQRSGRTRAWSRPVRRVCLEQTSAADRNVSEIARLINSRTTLSCRVIAERSPDIVTGVDPAMEREIRTRSQVKIDCTKVRLPLVKANDPDFLRIWSQQLRPALFGNKPPEHHNGTRRALSVSVIVSQENATGDEVAETVRGLWPDLLPGEGISVLARRGGSHSEIPLWIQRSKRMRCLQQGPDEDFIAMRNRAAGPSTADILVFVDANVEVPRQWISSLLEAFANTRVVAAGPAITDMYERHFTGFGMKWSDAELNTAWLPRRGDGPSEVPLLSGTFLAVRRRIFHQLGGFDPGMRGSGAEDAELCLRLWTLGFECQVVPRLEVLWMNPYASGAIRLHQYWSDLLYNLLRLATIHFAKERLNAFVEKVSRDAAFSAAAARVLDSNASRRRREIERSRRHSDGWFFERFAAL